MTAEDFENVLLEAIDQALASLGDSAKQAIYFHIENKFDVARDEIPHSLEAFSKGLEKIFGAGARFLEILVMKELYKRIGEPLEWSESEQLMFAKYIAAARQSFLKAKGC